MTRATRGSSTYRTNYLDSLQDERESSGETLVGEDSEGFVTKEERVFLDKIGEALARLGRVKRLGLGVKEKQDFIVSWTKSRRR